MSSEKCCGGENVSSERMKCPAISQRYQSDTNFAQNWNFIIGGRNRAWRSKTSAENARSICRIFAHQHGPLMHNHEQYVTYILPRFSSPFAPRASLAQSTVGRISVPKRSRVPHRDCCATSAFVPAPEVIFAGSAMVHGHGKNMMLSRRKMHPAGEPTSRELNFVVSL